MSKQERKVMKTLHRSGLVAYVAFMASFLLPIVAMADTLTWDGGASGNFSTGPWTSDGSHTTPQNGDTLVFGTAGSFANDIAGLSVAGLSITAAGNVEINGGQITLADGGSISQSGAGAATVSAPLLLGSASGETVYFAAAASTSLTLSGALSGAADVFLNNGSTDSGTIYLRNDGSDYTGATTARRGDIYVNSDDAFGSTDGATTLSGAASNALKVYFQGVTMSENFTVYANASDTPNNAGKFPVTFSANFSNTFNGTWSVSGNGYFRNDSITTTFNGQVSFAKTHFLGTGTLIFNGEGSTFAGDSIYGNTITYGAKCKCTGTMTVGKTISVGWINKVQRRNFDCEDAILYDANSPATLAFARVSCTADMCGHDQTFAAISCASDYASSVVTSTGDPSTIHLTLGGSSAVTSYAKFTGEVSLSFEGSQPISLGTAGTATGSLSLTNAAAVTLLDGFAWAGSSVTVAGDSTLTVGGVSLPTDTAVTILDDSAHSVISLNAGVDVSVESLRINGANMAFGKTYGATGSGADVIDDDHFAGTGVLRVLAGTPLTLTWNGGSSGTFSSASWSGGTGGHTTPLYGDTLVFPTGGVFENDIEGLSLAGLSFTSTEAVTLTGLQIAVANGGAVSVTGSGLVTNSAPLLLGTVATPAVNVDVASGCTLVMRAAISGAADMVYNNASTSTGTISLRNDGSDYTGTTTVRRGTVDVHSDDAFGADDGGTYFTSAAENQPRVAFYGVTMDEDFTCSHNHPDNPNSRGSCPVTFWNDNTFNGSWSRTGYGYYIARSSGSTITFNGQVNFNRTAFALQESTLVFNGEGSQLSAEYIYGGTVRYGAKVKGAATVGREHDIGWVGMAQTRHFDCADALLYDVSAPQTVTFARTGGNVDLHGNSQMFETVSCASKYSSCIVTSDEPATIHLVLGGATAVTNYAKAAGMVSYFFEGPRPYALGNTASTSTGSLSLTNAANVTLLDGFRWSGSSVTVADGSTLTVDGTVTFPKEFGMVLNDRAASGGNPAVSSKLVLNENMTTETLFINGAQCSGGKTYGATGSGANVIDDGHFSGTGVLRVKKPCGFVLMYR